MNIGRGGGGFAGGWGELRLDSCSLFCVLLTVMVDVSVPSAQLNFLFKLTPSV